MSIPDRRNITPGTANMRIYVTLSVIVCSITVAAVVILAIVQPNNTAAIATIIGLTTPITMTLLAAGLHGMSTSLDGRMTQLLQATAEKEHVKGVVEGLVANPKTNITEDDIPMRGRSE
jgi:uncharacterized membrane protein